MQFFYTDNKLGNNKKITIQQIPSFNYHIISYGIK